MLNRKQRGNYWRYNLKRFLLNESKKNNSIFSFLKLVIIKEDVTKGSVDAVDVQRSFLNIPAPR